MALAAMRLKWRCEVAAIPLDLANLSQASFTSPVGLSDAVA